MENRFYEGYIEYEAGPEPDPEAIAQAVNFLRSNDVAVKVGAGTRTDGAVRYPFLIKEPNGPSLLKNDDGKESVAMLKRLFEGCQITYRKAVPTIRRAKLLKECTILASTSPDSHYAEAADFVLRDKTLLAPGAAANAIAPAGAASARGGSASAAAGTAARAAVPADPFAHLVGMQAQKQAARELADAVSKHGRGVMSSCHLAFLGRPGTGKTELARALLAYFDQMGVTDGTGTFVKADAVNLIGRYVGETPRLVRDAVVRADGGVLFIDEAYRLANTGRGGNSFAPEAVNTLVEMMESRRERFVCVLAGYPREMEELMQMNPGLRDRIGFRVAFPDYAIDELVAIFQSFAERTGFTVDDEARAEVRAACVRLARLDDFANARTVRRLFERSVIKLSRRPGRAKAIRAADVRAALDDPDINGTDPLCRSVAVGFAG